MDKLRKAANNIDNIESPYKAIVSVLMLKEGWDVKNVTTIVGLRAYSSKSNILPEQTLGRGLRRMYRGQNIPELVSVVGTDAFMDFVESIRSEGVELETRKMGEGTAPKAPLIIEIDHENPKKDINKMDIQLPVLTRRINREYKNLSLLDIADFKTNKVKIIQFTEEEKREIIFKDITTDKITHKTIMDSNIAANYQSVIGYFCQVIMKELRLVSGYDILYGKVKSFIKDYLFDKPVNLEDLNVLRNLSELQATKTIIETFKKKINELTVVDKGDARIENYMKIAKCRPFVAKEQGYLIPQKSIFNKIIGDSQLELNFANFLENCNDIISYVKNYLAVHFKLEYQNANNGISSYYPDFIVKKSEKEIYIIETKGLEDLDVPLKIKRLQLWCEDINSMQSDIKYDFIFVDEEGFYKYAPDNFKALIDNFTKYKE